MDQNEDIKVALILQQPIIILWAIFVTCSHLLEGSPG